MPSATPGADVRRGRRRLGGAPPRRRYDDRGQPGASSRQPTVADPSRPDPTPSHLELVRRLNLAAGASGCPGWPTCVLATPSPGSRPVDVPLPWPGRRTPRFGSPAIDPAQLPEEELIRLAVGVLARLLPGVPRPAGTPELTRRWPVPWRRRFRLHGSPGTVAAVRRGLLAQGLVETDWRPTTSCWPARSR